MKEENERGRARFSDLGERARVSARGFRMAISLLIPGGSWLWVVMGGGYEFWVLGWKFVGSELIRK